jgi:hemerythrin
MAIMTWNDNFNIGIPQLDGEHKRLVTITNDLYNTMKQEQSKTAMDLLLNDLNDHVITHFFHEENFMLHYRYLDYTRHKQLHDNLATNVDAYRNLYDKDLLPMAKFLTMLQNSLMHHIYKTDQEYAPFIRSHM